MKAVTVLTVASARVKVSGSVLGKRSIRLVSASSSAANATSAAALTRRRLSLCALVMLPQVPR